MHTIQLSRNPSMTRRHRVALVDPSVRFVSATSMSADGEIRAIARPPVPNYALRRVVVGIAAVLAACVLAVGSIGVLAGLGSSSAAAVDVARTGGGAPSAHVADHDDTLWSVADEHRGDVGHGRYLEALIRRNGGTEIRVGQVIWLP